MQFHIYLLLSRMNDQAIASIDSEKVLSVDEINHFGKMKFSKRRNEWLQGRHAAKELLKRSLPDLGGLGFNEITIANEDDGAPYYLIGSDDLPQVSLSMSHRDEIVFCS